MSKLHSFIAIAKQSAKGTAATTGFCKLPLIGGNPLYTEKAHKEERETVKSGAEASVESVKHTGSVQMLAYKDVLPLFLAGILGTVATTGTTDKTHTISDGGALPRFTIIHGYSVDGATYVYDKLVDVLLTGVKITSETPTGNVGIEVSYQAETAAYDQSLPTITTDLTGSGKGKFIALGAVVKYSPISNTPVDVTAKVNKWELALSREVDETTRYGTGDIAVDAKFLKVACSATIEADKDTMRTIITGAVDGTVPKAEVIRGSFEPTLKASDEATHTLVATITDAVWKASDFLEAAPEGGKFTADISTDTDGAVAVLKVMNLVASY